MNSGAEQHGKMGIGFGGMNVSRRVRGGTLAKMRETHSVRVSSQALEEVLIGKSNEKACICCALLCQSQSSAGAGFPSLDYMAPPRFDHERYHERREYDRRDYDRLEYDNRRPYRGERERERDQDVEPLLPLAVQAD